MIATTTTIQDEIALLALAYARAAKKWEANPKDEFLLEQKEDALEKLAMASELFGQQAANENAKLVEYKVRFTATFEAMVTVPEGSDMQLIAKKQAFFRPGMLPTDQRIHVPSNEQCRLLEDFSEVFCWEGPLEAVD